MKNLKKSTFSLPIYIALLCVTGCEYVPREIHKIKTIDGEVVNLACPVVDAERSELTYLIEGDCVIYKSDS